MAKTGIKTFDDLEFRVHPTLGGTSKLATMNFRGSGWISVVGGPSLYGDGVTTFEVMSSLTDDDVLDYLSKEEVTEHMLELQTPVI
jgi:hypothetical protein